MTKTILCYGDSNTHGSMPMASWEDSRRFPKADRWPSVMAAALGESYDVITEGHPGRNSAFDDPVYGNHKNGLTILPALLESHKPLDLVIILLGTNDLKAQHAATAWDIALALGRLAALINASDCGPGGAAPRVLLAAPAPITEVGFLGEMYAGGAAKSRDLPSRLAEVARMQGAEFIDMTPVAQVDPLDGIHFDAQGLAAIGQAMAAKVTQIFSD